MSDPKSKVIVIDLSRPTVTCCVCGNVDLNNWGLPVDMETALICANDFDGDWGCKPACRECWEKHDRGELVGIEPKH